MKSIKLFGIGLLGLVLLGAGCNQAIQEEVIDEIVEEVSEEMNEETEMNEALDGAFVVDPAGNQVTWTGYGVGKEHFGSIDITASDFIFVMGEVATGELTIDMTTIKTQDIENEEMAGNLDAHLKNDDFFAVEDYPEAVFMLDELEWEGGDNYEASGELTLKGETNEVAFPVTLTEEGAGYRLVGTAVIDRTLYDVRFGSDKFFDNLGDATIKDEFDIDFDLLLVAEGTDAIGEEAFDEISEIIEEAEADHDDHDGHDHE